MYYPVCSKINPFQPQKWAARMLTRSVHCRPELFQELNCGLMAAFPAQKEASLEFPPALLFSNPIGGSLDPQKLPEPPVLDVRGKALIFARSFSSAPYPALFAMGWVCVGKTRNSRKSDRSIFGFFSVSDLPLQTISAETLHQQDGGLKTQPWFDLLPTPGWRLGRVKNDQHIMFVFQRCVRANATASLCGQSVPHPMRSKLQILVVYPCGVQCEPTLGRRSIA